MKLCAVILSSVFTWLAFPNTSIPFFIFIFAVPLIWVLEHTQSRKKGALYTFIFGFFLALHYYTWFLELSPWASVLGSNLMLISFSLYIATLYSILGFLYVSHKGSLPRIVLFPACYVLIEWFLDFGPFASSGGILGYALVKYPLILQLSQFTGVLGLSFFILITNVLIYNAIFIPQKNWPAFISKALLGYILFFCFSTIIYNQPIDKKHKKTVGIIQGNHAQNYKLDQSKAFKILNDYQKDIKKIASKDIIALPENVTPIPFSYAAYFVKNMKKVVSKNSVILIGTTEKTKKNTFNTLRVLSSSGMLDTRYRKELLMPFGEYIPFMPILKTIGFEHILSGFNPYTPGKNTTLVHNNNINYGIAICVESCFSHILRKQTFNGANILYVSVNTAWFNDSKASLHHFNRSIVRAVETNRYLIQASNIGYSAIITPKGHIQVISTLQKKQILEGDVYLQSKQTFFTRFPYLFPSFIIAILLISFVRLTYVRKSHQNVT